MHVLKIRVHVHYIVPYFSSCTGVDGRDEGLVGSKPRSTCEVGGWRDVSRGVGSVGAWRVADGLVGGGDSVEGSKQLECR